MEYLFLLLPLTAAASAVHGANLLTKLLVAGLHAIACAGIAYLGTGIYYSPPLAVALALAWWFILRRSRQENIENFYMHQMGKGLVTLHDVMQAHYYTGLLTCISLKFFNYGTSWGKWLGWEDQWIKKGDIRGKPFRIVHENKDPNKPRVHPDDLPFWDCRRPTEIATGLTGGLIMGGILWVFGGL